MLSLLHRYVTLKNFKWINFSLPQPIPQFGLKSESSLHTGLIKKCNMTLANTAVIGRSGQFRGQKGLCPLEKSPKISYYMFCPRKKKILPHLQSERYIKGNVQRDLSGGESGINR
jgi:hypothetical protein